MDSRISQRGFALLLSLIISIAIIIILAVGIYFGYSRQKGLVETGTEGIQDAKDIQIQSQENAQQMQDAINNINK